MRNKRQSCPIHGLARLIRIPGLARVVDSGVGTRIGGTGCFCFGTKEGTMLKLGRKAGERIIIRDKINGETIAVELCWVSGSKTRIGIDASKRYEIVRAELEAKTPVTIGPVS